MEVIQPTMEMNTELVCVMASLGYADGEDYFKGVDCLESLKDMIRFLRHEDLKICNIRRQMGHAKVLQNDLLPLLTSCAEDKELVDIVLREDLLSMRLLVNLTSAPELCFDKNIEEEEKNDREKKAFEIQMISYLQAYKEAFAEKSAMSTIGSHLGRILQLESMERGEEDVLLLERILLLIRNLLFIPSNPEDEKRTDDDVTIHDQLLWNLHVNGIDDLLIYLSSSAEECNWCMHALEILSHMFREQNAEELARTDENRSRKEKEEDLKKIAAILAREKAEKEKQLDFRGARHSRFGGSFWVKGRKALKEDEDLVYHRTLQSTKHLTHDFDKNPERKRKTKRQLEEVSKERKSTLSIRLFLKEFCMKFLEHGYNNLMSVVKSNLSSGRTQKHDETYYITVMRFFMAFNRVRSFKVEYVSQTFGIEAFNYIQGLVMQYLDFYGPAKISKQRELKMEYARRLKLAVSAYKELLTYIAVMKIGHDENLREAANVIQNNIFYTEEYRSLFIALLKAWNVAFQTKAFLKDVIEAFHLYLKLFEEFLKGKDTFLAKTKKVVKRARKKPTTQKKRCPIEVTAEQADDLWQDTVSVNLSACIQGREGGIPQDVIVPFDPVSDVSVDEQATLAFASIQRLLRCDQPGKAVAYLRASRECWVEEQRFGTANMSAEDEFMCLRGIYFMELPLDALQQAEEKLKDSESQEEEIFEEEEEEMPATQVKSKEKRFDLKPFLKQLGSSNIVGPYCYLLKSFKDNSSHTNHCIIKMLHRITVDLGLYAILFQLSVFVTFKKILSEPQLPENKEMKGFSKFIMRKFFEIYKEKPNVVVSALFWKNSAQCYTITEGEDFVARNSGKNKGEGIGKWSFEEEQELIDLHDQFKDEEDIIEKILEKLKSQGRTAHQIRNKLIRLRIFQKPKKRKANEWSEEETDELTRIFEEFKESDDPLGNIMTALSFKKGKKWVVAHLLETGLVSDRRELHKKRKKKIRVDGQTEDDENDLLIDENDEIDDDGRPEADERRSGSENEDSAGDDYDDDAGDYDDDDGDELSANATIFQIVQRLVEQDFRNQIEWIQGRLNRLADERDNSDEVQWQSVPLVPITDDHENALESQLFRRMLKRVGVSPPASEQEMFWRISNTLTLEELRGFARDLEYSIGRAEAARRAQATERQPADNIQATENAGAANANNDSEDEDYFERFISGNRRSAANDENDQNKFEGNERENGNNDESGSENDQPVELEIENNENENVEVNNSSIKINIDDRISSDVEEDNKLLDNGSENKSYSEDNRNKRDESERSSKEDNDDIEMNEAVENDINMELGNNEPEDNGSMNSRQATDSESEGDNNRVNETGNTTRNQDDSNLTAAENPVWNSGGENNEIDADETQYDGELVGEGLINKTQLNGETIKEKVPMKRDRKSAFNGDDVDSESDEHVVSGRADFRQEKKRKVVSASSCDEEQENCNGE